MFTDDETSQTNQDVEKSHEDAYYELARRNLEAAKLLYANKFYPQAVFYLEQSVEITAKLVGLLYQLINLEDMKHEIGHMPVKVYSKLFGFLRDQSGQILEAMAAIYSAERQSIVANYANLENDECKAIIDSVDEYIKDPTHEISEQKLEKIIGALAKIENELNMMPENMGAENAKKLKQTCFTLFESFSKSGLSTIPFEYSENVLKQFELLAPEEFGRIFSKSMKLGVFNTQLLCLSIILGPHAISSRYGDEKTQNTPLDVYNLNHYIVKHFDQLAAMTNGILDKIISYFGNSPE